MHTDFNICNELKAKEKCFRVQLYKNGDFKEVFHEHIPKSRISGEDSTHFLEAILLKNSQFEYSEMLKTFLNSRGKNPNKIKLGNFHTEYPEQGVLRKYLCAHGINSWYDEVISEKDFRC